METETQLRLLHAKCAAMVASIGALQSQERSDSARGIVGRDYMEARCMLAKLVPDVLAFLPPEIQFFTNDGRQEFSYVDLNELMLFYKQLAELLEVLMEQGKRATSPGPLPT